MSTIENKDKLRTLHKNLTLKIDGFAMPYNEFAKRMEDDEERSRLNLNLSKKIKGYSLTNEELDSILGVVKSDLPSPANEIQQMSRPENNTAIINDLSENLLKESNEIKKETEDPSIFETVGKGLASGIVRVGSGLMNQFSKVDPAILSSVAGGPNYVALYDPNRKTGKEQEKAAIEAATELRHISERLADEATPSNAKEKGFLGSLAEGNIGDAFQYALATTAQSIPQMLGYMNIYTMLPLAYAEFGAKMNELEESNPNMKEGKKIASAFGSTLIEVAIERLSGDFMKMFRGKVKPEQAKQITQELARQLERNVYKRALGHSLDFSKGAAKSATGEGVEEGLTYLLDKGYNSLIDLDGTDGVGLRSQYEKFKQQNPDADAGDFAKIITSELLESVAQGAMGGAYMHAGTSATAGVVNSFNKNRQIDNKVTVEAIKRVASEEGLKRLDVINKWGDVLSKKIAGEELTEEEIDFYNKIVNKKSQVAKFYGNINQSEMPKYNWSKDQLTEEQKKEYNRTIAEADKEKVEVAPVEIVLEEQEKQADTPSPIVSSTPTSSGAVSTPEIDTEVEVAKANATFGKASNKDGNLYEVSAFVNGKNVEGALKGEVVLTEDGKLDIENSKGLMFIPKGNGKYTSKAIPLTESEYNSITINNVFNKEQYAEQAVSNAEQAARAVSLNELISQALQAQSTPETTENGVAETSSSTEGGVTDNAVGNQVSYPTKKDGSIDYDNLTPEQEYSLTAQEYGEDVAQEDVKSYIEQYQSAIDNIQSQLDSKNGTNSRAKMREAMRKNQEKLEAWKALLKEEVVEQQEVAPVEETNALPKDVKTEDGNPVVEENSMPKDVNAEDVNKQTIDGGEKASTGEDVSLVEGIDRFLTGDEAQAFIAEMENSAEIAPEIELNIENWDALFGEDGRVETPIGEVKMGENQFAKLMRQGRNGKLGMIKPTLENPHAIVEVASEAKEGDTTERASSYIFIRSFKKADGSRFYYFTSITVSKDGREVVVSSQEKSRNKILRLLQEGSVIWRTPKDATTSSAERQGLDYEQPNEAETATKGSGITPQSTSSASEDTNIVPEKQEKVVESDENNNQTPEEVVQQAAIDTAEKRKEDALASFAESGAYTEALGAATEDTARKAEAFFKVIEEYGVRLTTKAPSINGNYIQFVQGRIGKLSEEQQSEVMEAAVAYKRAYMDQLVIEKFNSELANITDSKIHEEQTNSANEAIRNVKAANDNMLNDMVAKGDFSNEHMLITSHKDTEKSDVHTLEKPLLKERNNAMDDYQKRYDEVVNLNKTEERAKKRSEKRADVREGDIKRKKVWIKNREGEIVEGWVKGDETFESSGAYTIFRNETGKERYTPRKRKDIFKDENGSDSYAPVVKQGESEIEKRTIRIKRDVKTSDVSKNIVDLIGKIKTGDVGSVSELKDIIKSLKSKIVTLCKKINESDFSDEVKVYLLDELDSTYFFAEQQETDGVQKSPTPTKGKVADAILKIRTTPQQRRGNRTYVDDKGNVKERKNETFETIEDLLGANNEVVEIISDKLNNVHEIIEESESSLIVETPLYSEGTMSNSNPISLNEALKGIANLVRGFNLQGRIVVAMNLEQLKKINEKAYEAELNGEEVRGFYLPSKHQIVLYVPNLLSKGSVENVIFHEGVAHFGLRELLGEEEFNNFCKQVWKSMPYADKKAMMEYIGKEYVYNQKVSEGDMIAAAEEYVAHLAETPMFAEYLRNRNEQEAVSWIAKKWKKVCNLIRKIFKKRTGEELLSSDENIMDALYRSYQLLGSNDYAMFDYYRSLTEQMRKEDVKVDEINEEEFEEAYVNKATLGERSDEEKDDISFSNGKSVAEVNSRFNEELQKQIDGTLPKGHIYQLGMPSEVLKATGIPALPIQLSSIKLKEKATNYGHDYNLEEIKDLVKALNKPLAIFAYGDKEKAQNIVVEILSNDKNFVVGLALRPKVGGRVLEINSIRNVFPKDNAEWLNWIAQGKALYLDKERVQTLIEQQRTNLADVDYLDLNSIANIINNFENPSIESENSSSTQEQGTIIFSKGKPAGYVNLSNKFKPQKQPMSALVAREQAVANAVMEWFREMVGAENIVTDVRVATDVYTNALNNGERIRVLHTSKKGEDVILGFEHNGVHYLDMGAMDSGLLLYELGTVWVDILKKNDALWERAKEVCQSTKEYKSLVKTAAYKRGEVTEEDVVKEVLAYYISELGTRLGNNLNVSNDIKEEFEHKIGFAFAELKNTLSRFDEYELSKLGVEDFARLSLRDIVLNTSMSDSEAVVSELDDSDKGETLSEKRLKNSTYGWTSPRKNETTGEYLERMSRLHSHFLSRQTRRDGDSIIAMIQSAVEKASGKMIPEAIDVYNIIDSINSVIANRVETFEKKLWNPLRNTIDSMGKKLMRNKEISSIMKARKLSTIEWYLRAKDIVEYSEIHNKDRGRKGLENVLGMTLERYIGIVEGTLGLDNINSLWDKINEITDITLKNKESAGVLDATDLATMKRRYYIPEKGFDTDAETDNDGNKKLTRKSNRVSSSYQKERSTKGRGNTVSDSPSFNIFTDMVASIQAKEHTRLNNAFYGLIEYAELYDKGIADRFFKRTENGSLIHKEGGDIRVGNLNDNDYLVFNETKLGRKLKEVLETNPESISAFTSWWKGWVSKTNTAWRLSFAITNLGKDLFQTIPVVYMKYGPKTTGKVILNLLNPVTIFELLSYIYARKTYKSDNIYLSGVYGQEKLIKEFFENGVATGYLEYRNDDDVRKAIGKGLFDTWKNKYRESALGQKTSQIESPIWLENVGDLAGKIVTSPKYIGKAVRGISDWSEIAARYALYKTLREDNYSMHSARMAARNTTMNLGRDAGGKIYKTLGRIFPFYRATVNAGEAWNRALFEMQEGDNGYKKTLRVVTMLAPAVILGLFTFNDDDDDEEEDSFIRTNNFFSKFFINNFPVNVSESYVPFLQLGNGIKRYLKGEKEASDVALDFTAGICQTVITSNTFSETLIDMAKSMLTKGTIEEKDFERLISQYLNELPLATAAVNMDAFGNKIATENNDKNDWANASGEADYIFRAIADYLHGFDDERLGEKKSYIGFDEKGEIETFDAKTMYDVNSDILQAVVYQLFKPAEEAIKPLSNILEQKVKGEEFSWMELGQNVPVIKKSFVDYPKTSKEKLESSVRLLTKFDNYVSHASKGEGFNQLNNKEKSMYNNYIKSSLFEDDNTKLNDNAAQWIMEGGLKKTIIADIEYAIEYGDEKYCEKVFREYDDYVRNVRKFMFGN